MKGQVQRKEKCILVILLVASLVAAVIKIFVGFDIDEGYAVSMPYRLLQGDRLFKDMWEVHQTSAFLPAFFLFVYEKITGVTEGVVVYLRVIATLIHGMMTLLVWKSLSRRTDFKWSMLLALLYFNFLPKWLMSLDFSMQQVWGLTGIILLLQRELETGKNSYDFWMGVVLAATVLAYPGMVLCYPALLATVCILYKSDKINSKFNKCLIITIGCACMAVFFFGYVFSGMGVQEFIESIPMIFMDGTHQFTFQTKLLLYVTQWLNVGKQLLILSLPSIMIAIVIKRVLGETDYLLSFVTLTSGLVITANVFGIEMGPFHFQVRYLLFYICTFIWYGYRMVKAEDKERRWFNTIFLGSFFLVGISFLAILIFSNVGPDSSSSYLSVGVIGGWLFYDTMTKEGAVSLERLPQKGRNWAGWIVLAVFVLSLVFCKGYYVRITEYGPSTILQERWQITEGPLKGIYVLPQDYDRITEDYRRIREATEKADSFLYLGTEGISNLYAECSFVSPSTISTPAFNEQWVFYFETHPEKEPEVIAIAKNTIDDLDKFFARNPFGRWIVEKYDILHMEETNSLCIIKRK